MQVATEPARPAREGKRMKVARLIVAASVVAMMWVGWVPSTEATCVPDPITEQCMPDEYYDLRYCIQTYGGECPQRYCIRSLDSFCPYDAATYHCPNLDDPCPVYTETQPGPQCVGICGQTRPNPQPEFVFFDNPVPDVTVWLVPCWYPQQYAFGAVFIPHVNVEDACIIGTPPVDTAGPIDESEPLAPCAEVPVACQDSRPSVDITPVVPLPGLCVTGARVYVLDIYITTLGTPHQC